MDYFKTYSSNTLGASGNQSFYKTEDKNKIYTCRTYYKVFCEGEYNYSLLFTNTTDSTFADGSISRKNKVLDSWEIISAKIGRVSECSINNAADPSEFIPLTFDGIYRKTVAPGEFFTSDPAPFSANENEYICLELSYKGSELPCHPETLLPSFVYTEGVWKPSVYHPFASMIGTDRCVKAKIGFFGDSITQGIGTAKNSYKHWNALLSDNVGKKYSYWNLGLGYGRADDAASDGAWMFKAKQCDIVFVCFGVNDISRGFTKEQIKNSLAFIVRTLKSLGKTVILQTIPPFNYFGERIELWENVNSYIKNDLSNDADLVFDCASFLWQDEDHKYNAKYNGHPNEEGCKIWADKLSKELSKLDLI